MSVFRQRLIGVLGTAVSAAACQSAEARLREGMVGDDLCTQANEERGAQFSHVTNLRPAQPVDYLEWRVLMPMDAEFEPWTEIKDNILQEASLSDAERQEQLDAAFLEFAAIEQHSGSCELALGCDRFVLSSELGFFSWTGSHHLFASGDSGATTVTNEEQVLAFLGTIDTPHEAAWLAFAQGNGIPCNGRTYRQEGDSFLLYTETGSTCGGDVIGHRLRVSADGKVEELDSDVVEEGDPGCVIGRLPSGAISLRCRKGREHPVGRYFADIARLEAASIFAFRELARELEHYQAPRELVSWAERSAIEENLHATNCAHLARRYGVHLEPVLVAAAPIRRLFDIARDNVTEGLTREAFGALVAHYQASAAKDPAVRSALARIARDETNHAEFSIALHRWLLTQLDDAQRGSLEQARVQARIELGATLHPNYDRSVVELAGLPTPDLLRALFDELFAVDWAA